MKKKRLYAILLSAALALSACIPVNAASVQTEDPFAEQGMTISTQAVEEPAEEPDAGFIENAVPESGLEPAPDFNDDLTTEPDAVTDPDFDDSSDADFDTEAASNLNDNPAADFDTESAPASDNGSAADFEAAAAPESDDSSAADFDPEPAPESDISSAAGFETVTAPEPEAGTGADNEAEAEMPIPEAGTEEDAFSPETGAIVEAPDFEAAAPEAGLMAADPEDTDTAGDSGETEDPDLPAGTFYACPEEEGAAPDIEADTLRVYATAGEPLRLSVLAGTQEGSTLSFVWRDPKKSVIEGADTREYTIAASELEFGTYTCEVSDSDANTKTISFNVGVENHFHAYPDDDNDDEGSGVYSVQAGKDIELRVKAEADVTDGITYRWFQRENVNSDWDLIPEETLSTCTLKNISKRTLVCCMVSDRFGNEAEVHFTIKIYSNLVVTPRTRSTYKSVRDGNTLEVYVPYNGDAILRAETNVDSSELSFSWYTDNSSYEENRIEGADSRDFTFDPRNGFSDTYVCNVADNYGNDRDIFFYIYIDNDLRAFPKGMSESTRVKYIDIYPGQKASLQVSAKGEDPGTEYTFLWEDKDEEMIEDADDAPRYDVTLRKYGYYTYYCEVFDQYDSECRVTFHVRVIKKPLNKARIALLKTAYTYNGSAIVPTATVVFNKSILKKGTDYKVSCSNNINAGTATATYTGMGEYTGTVKKTFTITKASQPIKVSVPTTALAIPQNMNITISGAVTTPKVTVSDSSVAYLTGTRRITARRVGWTDIVVTAPANGNYKETTRTVSIKVLPSPAGSLRAENLSNGVRLSWLRSSGATGYTIYRNNKKIKTITSGSTRTFTDTGAKTNNTAYDYRVYAYASTGTNTNYASVKTIYLSRPSISSIWSGGAGKMALTWGKLAGVYGYEIYFSQNSSFSSARGYRITPYSKTSTTFTDLTRGKTYYVRMRCIKIPNTSTRYYSDWSPVRTVKIK